MNEKEKLSLLLMKSESEISVISVGTRYPRDKDLRDPQGHSVFKSMNKFYTFIFNFLTLVSSSSEGVSLSSGPSCAFG